MGLNKRKKANQLSLSSSEAELSEFEQDHHPLPQVRALSSLKLWGGRVVRWCWVNFQCWGVLLIWIGVGQGPTALAVGAGGGCLDIFSLVYHFSFFLPLSGRRPDID